MCLGEKKVTFQTETTKMIFEVVDSGEEDFDVQDELFRHSYSFQVLNAAHMPKHVRDASRT